MVVVWAKVTWRHDRALLVDVIHMVGMNSIDFLQGAAFDTRVRTASNFRAIRVLTVAILGSVLCCGLGWCDESSQGDGTNGIPLPTNRIERLGTGVIYHYLEPETLSLAVPVVVTLRIADKTLQRVVATFGGVPVETLKIHAARGDAAAQVRLAAYYFDGKHGLDANRIEGYRWAWIANQSGHPSAKSLLSQFELFMTPDEVTAAKKTQDRREDYNVD